MNIIIEKKNNTYTVISMDPNWFLRKTRKHRNIKDAIRELRQMYVDDNIIDHPYRKLSVTFYVVNTNILTDKEKKALEEASRIERKIIIQMNNEYNN